MGAVAAAPPAVPTLTAEFVDVTGRLCRRPLSEAWATPFEHAAPVRSLPSFRGQKNFTGLYYAATMDAHVGFESCLERDVAMTLDFDTEVVAFSSQPFCLSWPEGGRRHWHTPDFFARLEDGTGVVIDVRPDDRIGPRDVRAFAVTETACEQVGWLFRRTAIPKDQQIAKPAAPQRRSNHRIWATGDHVAGRRYALRATRSLRLPRHCFG